METATILVVCTGNIRRSPAVEAMLREGVGPNNGVARHGISVMSAGTEALAGYEMDPVIATEVAAVGVRLSRHEAYGLTAEDIDASDLIITAERSHRREVAKLVPSAVTRTFTLIEIAALGAQIGRQALGGNADAAERLRTLVDLAPLQKARRTVRRPADDDLIDLRKRSPREARRLVGEARVHVERLLRVLEPEPGLSLVNKAHRSGPHPALPAPTDPPASNVAPAG
ncbi:protein-tyrosine phosphatase [Nocardioides albertanoniae]|uniref:Protein-tyrosine phosphatase n=1 Tax=Nocardioides albertanoniae TaxID=1175486 RepID=A0A543ABH3_9ACTN|nr:hypothetical protein [Nocardioides albertanoniae]TQL69948.1 protein-tyrosine phosphatase [Nocardioides albertanoniae]